MLYAIVALLVIILDQWTKFWVAGHIALNTGSIDLIPGFLKLVNIHNDGAALGFLSGKNAGMLFIILCAVFTIFVIIALATKLVKAPVGRWSLLFIMAGGLSNCIDRLLSGYVQDMFMPTFMDKLPIFNVADIFITVFCLIFILFVLFGGRRDEEDYDDEDEDEELEDEEEEEEEEEEAVEKKPRSLGAVFGSKARRDEEEAEDESEDEEEEAEEKPRGLFAGLRSRSRGGEDEEEDEDEEEEEESGEDEEEDDLPPARRPSRYDRAARNGKRPVKHAARRSRDEDEDLTEDEDEAPDEAPAPRRARAEKKEPAKPKRSSRRDRQAELDEKYARFKAERAAREQKWSAEAPEKPAVVDPDDPFAEWDAAARKAEEAVKPDPVSTPAPAVEPAPVEPAPAPAAPKAKESMEFSLEDILAEFK